MLKLLQQIEKVIVVLIFFNLKGGKRVPLQWPKSEVLPGYARQFHSLL